MAIFSSLGNDTAAGSCAGAADADCGSHVKPLATVPARPVSHVRRLMTVCGVRDLGCMAKFRKKKGQSKDSHRQNPEDANCPPRLGGDISVLNELLGSFVNLASLLETYGDHWVLAFGGGLIGLLFGFSGQRSKFCARAAVIESCEGEWRQRFAGWMLAFATAMLMVQAAIALGFLNPANSRHLGSQGSISGAILGGFMFGVGMIMSRGCASRLIILSANGNLRAWISGLVFAVTVQATLSGALAPVRQTMASWWLVDGGPQRNLLTLTGTASWMGLALGLVFLGIAIWRFRVTAGGSKPLIWGNVFVGAALALGWYFTQWIASASFEPVPVQGLSFSSPSAEWLNRVLYTDTAPKFGFDAGLLPGVFVGSFLAAILFGDFKFEGFQTENKLGHYLSGAILMGFGAVLAGGCTVGAGMSGGIVFSNTAWLTLLSIIAGAAMTYKFLKSIGAPT